MQPGAKKSNLLFLYILKLEHIEDQKLLKFTFEKKKNEILF